jgi:hypothetical protein
MVDVPYDRIIDRMSSIELASLNEYERASIETTIRLMESKLSEEQLQKLNRLRSSKTSSIPHKVPPILKKMDPLRKQLFELPNLLEETKPKQFKYEPKGDLFNRAKKKEDISELEMQEHLTGILAEQSSQLLENTKRFNDTIQKDTKDLSEMEYRLENINLRVKSARQSMKNVSSSTWSTTIMIWVSILGVMLIVAWMILFMKFF